MIWRKTTEGLPKQDVSVLTRNSLGFYGIERIENGKWRMCTLESIAGLLSLREYTLEKLMTAEFWAYIDEPNIEGK
jgi:hypothetical protein